MKSMKLLHSLAGFLCSVCLMAILLITSIEAVAYWIPGYYEKEYTIFTIRSIGINEFLPRSGICTSNC